MKDKVLVSFASHGRENYNFAMLRMIRASIEAEWDSDYMLRSLDGYCDEYLGVKIKLGSWPVTARHGVSWQQDDNPYQFKPFAILEALEAGYKKILWCDSTIRMVKNPRPLFEIASKQGIVAFNNEGFPLKNWLSDHAQHSIGISNKELEGMPQIMACCILFDFNVPITNVIFDKWIGGSLDGSFQKTHSNRPGYRASRHDQSYLSGLLNKHGIPFLPYGTLVYPPHDKEPFEYGNNFYFINTGL